MRQYPQRVECKYSQHQIVWVLNLSSPQRAIVVKADCEDGPPAKYDVMLLNGDNTEVDPDAGSITICGLEEHRVYEEPIGAARELYQIYALHHHELGIAMNDCIKNWDDPDYITKRFEKYEQFCEGK